MAEDPDAPKMEEELISAEEWYLSRKLRSCCSPSGAEQRKNLYKSASILLELGKLYLRKATQCDGMLQKLTFIKCASLLSGSRVRFEEILEDKIKTNEVRNVLREMSETLLKTCRAQITDYDVMATADSSASFLHQYREKEKMIIEQKLAPFDDDIQESEILGKRKQKVEIIQHLMKENSLHYRVLMNGISQECIRIIGRTPCKFTLVGLGSLAREEVTLYSDFEHVIILEEGVQNTENYDAIKEYFRWYSVLFHVIIIGLGESYIPSVGVKSLNDIYSENKAKNWFFDVFTPGGVSFDGRFPHACKTPIGKQESSKYRKHIVELIQPVSKMMSYLSSEQDLKNGYHLKDVLTTVCFVHGDEEMYNDYKMQSFSAMIAKSRDQEVAEQAKYFMENLDVFVGNSSFNRDKLDFEKAKNFLYRPITLMVGSFAKIFRLPTASSFDFFSVLRKHSGKPMAENIELFLRDLEYAVAVACEIRLKVYAAAGKQRLKASPRNICKFVGRSCVLDCFKTIMHTSNLFGLIWESKSGYKEFMEYFACIGIATVSPANDLFDAQLLRLFGFYEDEFEAYERIRSTVDSKSLPPSFLAPGKVGLETRDAFIDCIEESHHKRGGPADLTFDYVRGMSHIHFYKARDQDGLDLIEKWIERHRENDFKNVSRAEYVILIEMKTRFLFKLKGSSEVIEYCREDIPSRSDVYAAALGILLKKGISDFCTIAAYFAQAPTIVLRHQLVHNNLTRAVELYCDKIPKRSFCEVGLDLLAVFRAFPEYVYHPRLIGILRYSVAVVVKKSLSLKYAAEKDATKYTRTNSGGITRLFNRALRAYAALNMKASAGILWKLINYKKGNSDMEATSSKFLAHIITVAPFGSLIYFLRTLRPNFIARHSFPSVNGITVMYNDAFMNYYTYDLKESALAFWRIIFASKDGSRLRKRSIEMLMFVIIANRESEGYLPTVGENYISNEKTKQWEPAHINQVDYYPMLSLSAEDTSKAIRNS